MSKYEKYYVRPTTDHDKKAKVKNQTIFCYSKGQLDSIFPDGDYEIIGETLYANKAEEIATLVAGKCEYIISEEKSHNRILFGVLGYIRVGENQFVALLHCRIAFLILLGSGIAVLGILAAILVGMMQPKPPIIIDPDHPLPTVDSNVESLPSDPNGQKPTVPEGGGSLSMIYTLEAELSLSTGVIKIYFKNPTASSHDVSVILYIIAGDQEIAIAQSGLIKAGYGLSMLEFVEGTARLQEGVYTGKYVLSCFDPYTGERALVQPEIAGVTITVVP